MPPAPTMKHTRTRTSARTRDRPSASGDSSPAIVRSTEEGGLVEEGGAVRAMGGAVSRAAAGMGVEGAATASGSGVTTGGGEGACERAGAAIAVYTGVLPGGVGAPPDEPGSRV